MRRHLLVDALEHVTRRWLASRMQRAEALSFFLRRNDRVENFSLRLLVTIIRPDAAPDQMVLQPNDRIPQRPSVGLGFWPVGRRIIRSGMRADTVGDILDQCRPEVAPGTLDCPFGYCKHRQIIVPVDTQSRNAEAKPARCKCARTASGNA